MNFLNPILVQYWLKFNFGSCPLKDIYRGKRYLPMILQIR